jgi:hypothetical protein
LINWALLRRLLGERVEIAVIKYPDRIDWGILLEYVGSKPLSGYGILAFKSPVIFDIKASFDRGTQAAVGRTMDTCRTIALDRSRHLDERSEEKSAAGQLTVLEISKQFCDDKSGYSYQYCNAQDSLNT